MAPLEKELQVELLDRYEKWKTVGYSNSYFMEMVRETKNKKVYKGPVQTVRDLLLGEPGKGFTTLVRAGKVQWTVEALITSDPKWEGLFTERELKKAAARLAAA